MAPAAHARPERRGRARVRARRTLSAAVLSAAGLVALACALGGLSTSCWLAGTAPVPPAADDGEGRPARRGLVAASLLTTVALGAPAESWAFANRFEEVKGPKRPGVQPPGVGQGGPLVGCGNAPNCFSSAPGTDEDHFLTPWRFSSGGVATAFADIASIVRAYPPGQRGIDGGGFEIKRSDAQSGYLYVQFEALKKGYIDDVEFVVRSDSGSGSGEVLVRCASRVGRLDMGVNAKRLNRISEDLQQLPGGRWAAPKISPEAFPKYVNENR
mmetsp:Transcript_62170/g.158083  ORF Transcript_62170/g.158083 Transcript_62170/m.158083 type:complete len:271 (-) Transcript_62170:55-867(-)